MGFSAADDASQRYLGLGWGGTTRLDVCPHEIAEAVQCAHCTQ